MSDTVDGTCENCIFFDPQGKDDEFGVIGQCYRYPPHFVGGYSLHPDSFEQPTVSEGEWCGEFKQRQHPEPLPPPGKPIMTSYTKGDAE